MRHVSTVSSLVLLSALSSACGVDRRSLRSGGIGESDDLSLVELAPGSFVQAALGCSGAHCDNKNSDRVGLPSAKPGAKLLRKRTEWGGASFGLGCSSNGTLFGCTFLTKANESNLVIFDADANPRWMASSDPEAVNGLSSLAASSAPIIDASGAAIVADQRRITRFNATGGVAWTKDFPSGGLPISPVLLADGTVFMARTVLAPGTGSSLAYRSSDGELIDELSLKLSPSDPGAFSTVNTPSSRGNRVYVSTAYVDAEGEETGLGRLYAIDVDPSQPVGQRLKAAWFFEFQSPSGASPTVVGDRIYFDGMGVDTSSPTEPTAFGLRDLGTTYEKLFAVHPVGKKMQASFGSDPRGGLWLYALGETAIVRIDETSGATLQTIDVSKLVGSRLAYGAQSVFSVAGTAAAPVLHISAGPTTFLPGAPTYVLGIDAATSTKTFLVQTGLFPDVAAGQFPVVKAANGDHRVVFSTMFNGPYVVGSP